jgi:D-3-phosphoglycerate dehydrogenase
MPKIFISTIPFGETDPAPIRLLKKTGWEYKINPLGRKLSPNEVAKLALDCDGVIAGTEDLRPLIEKTNKLKIISRVGIGLDSVPLALCREKGITVVYTPDAVTMAVAELTVGIMIALTRHTYISDRNIRHGEWKRRQGKRIRKSIIGIIGLGRIGTNVVKLLVPFRPEEVLINDIKDKSEDIAGFRDGGLNIRQVEKKEIYRNSDIVSIHIPLWSRSRNLINAETLQYFKKEVFLINLARGGIVNEADLYKALITGRIGGAAIDCFEEEPYCGPLAELDNVLLTPHMGSCSFDCRVRMELEATQDLIRFFQREPLMNEVPEEEYFYQNES